MILILSENDDVSTDKVCFWLNYYKAEYIRTNSYINAYDIIGNVKFENDTLEFELIINGQSYNLSEITTIWCRRGYISFIYPAIEDINYNDNEIYKQVKKHINNELNTLERFFEHVIEQKFHINNPNHYNSNKLIALHLAQKHGLKIPETLITKSSQKIKDFFETQKTVITKNIQDVLNVREKDFSLGHCHREIFAEDIRNHDYFYSLFQRKIGIKYELRIFFLFDKYYSHAKIAYNNDLSRITPFKLPNKIEKKLQALMYDLKLQSGSIDMIVDEKDDYYFLEVNPVGQFDYLSGFNNYLIEREIAKTLMYGKEQIN